MALADWLGGWLAVDVAVRVRGLLRVALRRIRARPRRSRKPKAKVATHAAAGARAEVSKLKPQAAVHTHAALRLLADGEVAHRVGGRVDAALAKPVTKRRGSVGHRSRLDACALWPHPSLCGLGTGALGAGTCPPWPARLGVGRDLPP